MRSNWLEVPLGDLGDFKNGANFNKTDYGDAHPVINVKNLFRGRFATTDDLDSLSADALKRIADYFVEKNDILFARSSVKASGAGQVALVREFQQGTVFSGFIIRFRVTDERLNPMYLYYLLRSPEYRELLTRIATGTTISNLSQATLSKLPVRFPPRHEQDLIVAALDSLDSKTEHNHQINQTLERIAQAVFKSWFVDFEPVTAKIAARERWHALQPGNEPASPVCYAGELEDQPIAVDLDTYMNHAAMQAISDKDAEQLAQMQAKQPERYAELLATAVLFPSVMQDSELGEIPEGWEAGNLSNIAEFSSERISAEQLSHENYVSTENMLEGKKGVYPASSLPSSSTVPGFENKHVLVSNIRPYFKKIWFANRSGGRSPDVLGFKCTNQGTHEFLYNVLYQDAFFDYIMLTSKGAKMPRGDKKSIMRFELALPPVEVMMLFSQRVESFYVLVSSNNSEAPLLASLRETLLPKLLSGELKLPDVDETQPEPQDVAHV